MDQLLNDIIDHYDDLKYSLLDAQTFNTDHFGFPPVYYKIMETDQVRVDAYRKTFEHFNMLKDAVVCEAGVGTLALTKHFLPYVKKAYLIEFNPNLTEFIQAELEKNGWADKVEFIVADARKVDIPEPLDFVIGELMSIYCANELQVQIFQHLRKFLKPDGKLIPDKIVNTAQLVEAQFDPGHRHYPLMFTRHWPMTFSVEEVVNVIDLYKEEETHIKKDVPFTPVVSGEANSILMRSLIQLTEGINFTGTDSLMPPTVMQLTNPASIKSGVPCVLNADYQYGTSLDLAHFTIR